MVVLDAARVVAGHRCGNYPTAEKPLPIVTSAWPVEKGADMGRDETVLSELMAVIGDRKTDPPADSYTAKLFAGGVDAIGAKVCEEAAELVEAARRADRAPQDVVHEAADLIYHLLVMMAHCGVELSQVEAELARRRGTSGLAEKRSRRPE